MSIFTERDDDRMDKSQARNSIERRDELIEELVSALKRISRCFDSEGRLVHTKIANEALAKAEREGYGQGPGAA